MSFLENVGGIFIKEAKKYSVVRIKQGNTDVDFDAAPFVEGESYCRVWLVEMCLEKGVEWLKKRYPVVCSAVRFQHGDKEITLPYIAGPDYLKTHARDNYDRIIQLDHPLTPLFPFQHGLLEIQAGLFSLVAADWVNRFVNTLDRFSKMVRIPELSSAVRFAAPVCAGIEDLLGIGDNRLEIGYQQTFTGTDGTGNRLTPGYFVILRAEPNDVAKLDLGVREERLCVTDGKAGEAKPVPLAGLSYMLFKIEKQAQQNWEQLTQIKKLFDAAVRAANGKTKALNSVRENLRIAVATSPDIARAHRPQVWENIKAAIGEMTLHGAATTDGSFSLYPVMQRNRPISPETVAEVAAVENLF